MVWEIKKVVAEMLNRDVNSFQLRIRGKYLDENLTLQENEYSAEEIIYAIFKRS